MYNHQKCDTIMDDMRNEINDLKKEIESLKQWNEHYRDLLRKVVECHS